MDTIELIHKLLLKSCEEAYNEGRTHQRNSTSAHIREGYAMSCRKMPKCFEDTETYAAIMKEYNEIKSWKIMGEIRGWYIFMES